MQRDSKRATSLPTIYADNHYDNVHHLLRSMSLISSVRDPKRATSSSTIYAGNHYDNVHHLLKLLSLISSVRDPKSTICR